MFNMHYQNNLSTVNDLRYILFTNFYNDINKIEVLKQTIMEAIECLSIDYIPNQFSFLIKVKKTAMRKRYHGFVNNPIFYYNIIQSIFCRFVQLNENDILKILSNKYPNPNDVLLSFINNPAILTNLAMVTCMDDNVVMIKL